MSGGRRSTPSWSSARGRDGRERRSARIMWRPTFDRLVRSLTTQAEVSGARRRRRAGRCAPSMRARSATERPVNRLERDDARHVRRVLSADRAANGPATPTWTQSGAAWRRGPFRRPGTSARAPPTGARSRTSSTRRSLPRYAQRSRYGRQGDDHAGAGATRRGRRAPVAQGRRQRPLKPRLCRRAALGRAPQSERVAGDGRRPTSSSAASRNGSPARAADAVGADARATRRAALRHLRRTHDRERRERHGRELPMPDDRL